MAQHPIPEDIVALAEERSTARAEREWATADALKARIEAGGWRVVDDGTSFSLRPLQPPDLVVEGETLYGSAASVPSRLDVPATSAATVAIIGMGSADVVQATLDASARTQPPGTQLLVVADAATRVVGPEHETVRGVDSFSAADALTVVRKRATGTLVIVIEAGRLPTGDLVAPLREALADPSVAIAGCDGLDSTDLHRYSPASNGSVTALAAGCYAFRRDDAVAAAPADARLRLATSVATWWSLTLRDAGPVDPPRRAVSVALPITTPADAPADAQKARLARRDRYRLTELLGERRWLAADTEEVAGVPGERPQGDHEDDHNDQPDHTPSA